MIQNIISLRCRFTSFLCLFLIALILIAFATIHFFYRWFLFYSNDSRNEFKFKIRYQSLQSHSSTKLVKKHFMDLFAAMYANAMEIFWMWKTVVCLVKVFYTINYFIRLDFMTEIELKIPNSQQLRYALIKMVARYTRFQVKVRFFRNTHLGNHPF